MSDSTVVGFTGKRCGPTPQDLENFGAFFDGLAARAREGEFLSAVVTFVGAKDECSFEGYGVPSNHKLLQVASLERAKMALLDSIPSPVWADGEFTDE